MKQEYRQAFTEVYEIFKLMPQELLDMIPKKFIKMIEEERDIQYITNIKEPLEEQKLKDETIIILGLIYRDFLCLPEERKKLQEKDAKELGEVKKTIEEEIKQKYNSDNLFNNKEKVETKIINEDKEKSLVVVKEEKWYKQIFNVITNLFKKKE